MAMMQLISISTSAVIFTYHTPYLSMNDRHLRIVNDSLESTSVLLNSSLLLPNATCVVDQVCIFVILYSTVSTEYSLARYYKYYILQYSPRF